MNPVSPILPTLGDEAWAVPAPADSGANPLLILPLDGMNSHEDSMIAGGGAQIDVPILSSLGALIDAAGTMYLCLLDSTAPIDAPAVRIERHGAPDFGLAVSESFKNQSREGRFILFCAYTDIFLAAHIGESGGLEGETLTRLYATSKLGFGRVLRTSSQISALRDA
jgi:hypothetical protein